MTPVHNVSAVLQNALLLPVENCALIGPTMCPGIQGTCVRRVGGTHRTRTTPSEFLLMLARHGRWRAHCSTFRMASLLTAADTGRPIEMVGEGYPLFLGPKCSPTEQGAPTRARQFPGQVVIWEIPSRLDIDRFRAHGSKKSHAHRSLGFLSTILAIVSIRSHSGAAPQDPLESADSYTSKSESRSRVPTALAFQTATVVTGFEGATPCTPGLPGFDRGGPRCTSPCVKARRGTRLWLCYKTISYKIPGDSMDKPKG